MFASVPSLIKTRTSCTLFTELESCKHSDLPALKLTFVSKNFKLLTKCGKDRNKISSMTHKKRTGKKGIEALRQHVFIDKSLACPPIFSTGGLESNINNLSKWTVIGFFYTVILLRHDAKALWLALGANLNGILSIVLKKIIKQDRPLPTLKSDFGMPSTHAQSIFFNVFMANLSIMEFFGMNGFVATIAGIILALGSYCSWLRISKQDHTVSQVMVGALVGSIFCIFWFWLWDSVVVEAFSSYLWIRLMLVFGGLGTSLLLTLRCFRDWILEAK
ncbi:Lipid phosphate phosphatase epsilon 1, chloroplastic [Heracleum sosnowskyi]|uniref:Lipid phosphate phosphatase epsilon 1, chloroplastic n=1 Tax=Heracleum sosnowskyi TaxID=360622 RepID=A0AAD8HC55_9APIA|nr:Lipid phosphate phosphatase epsilon 1, chloroplastic [Heracleum sosnowskyi]